LFVRTSIIEDWIEWWRGWRR